MFFPLNNILFLFCAGAVEFAVIILHFVINPTEFLKKKEKKRNELKCYHSKLKEKKRVCKIWKIVIELRFCFVLCSHALRDQRLLRYEALGISYFVEE